MKGFDPFRIPKEVVFMAAAIVIGAILAIGWLRQELDFSPLLRHRLVLLILAMVLGWTLITTLTSTNRALSWQTTAIVVASIVLFAGFYLVITKLPIAAAAVVFSAGVPNAVVLLLQFSGVWNFIDPGGDESAAQGRRYALTGLLGNANDAGGYLLINMLIAIALGLEVRGALRVIAFALAALMAAGMAATLTRSAIVAAVISVAMLVVARMMTKRRSWRFAAATLGLMIALGALALAVRPIRERAIETMTAARSGNIHEALSGRTVAWRAAWRMFKDRPLLGVGPGCYKFQYFDKRVEIVRDDPQMAYVAPLNFGEAHNDHLQVLAETGLPGFAIFLFANLAVAAVSLKSAPHDDARARFARTIALPAVVGLFITAIAQFPIELAAPRITYLFAYALCLNWSMRWSDAS
jgi:O-antigen ligase